MTDEASWIRSISTDDSPETILQKAAQIRPHPRQQAWQALELTAFIHFGINTFTDREWGTGLEDPALFNPSALDARQWTQVLKAAGFQQVILTAKHHDGFCLWPSRYTDFSVKSSPWQGDVVRALTDAAREAGLKVGLYLSPADLHEMEAPGGRYGNGSPSVVSQIPTLAADDARQPQPNFSFIVDDYNRYYLNQLYELLTEYGPIHEVWFDGANPKPGVAERYQYSDWFSLVRALAPDAVMFNGPDIRWVGNESGFARDSEWSVIPFQGEPDSGLRPLDPLAVDLGSRDKLTGANYLAWYPSEVDVSIRPGWFYHATEDEQVKSLDQLLNIYEYSVGRNSVLLLNIPPDRCGRFADADCARLLEFGEALRRSYQNDLGLGAYSAGRPVPESGWQLPGQQVTGELVLDLAKSVVFNQIVVQENPTHGQHVEAFAVDAWLRDDWQTIAEATTIGYKRLLKTDSIETQRIRLRILAARSSPVIQRLSLFLA